MAEVLVVVITATVGSGKARVVVGVEVKVAVLAGVVVHLVMDQVSRHSTPISIHNMDVRAIFFSQVVTLGEVIMITVTKLVMEVERVQDL